MRFLLLSAACAAIPSIASAAIVSYTDRTSFEAALGSLTIETFESVPAKTTLVGAPVQLNGFTLQAFSQPSASWNFIGDKKAWVDPLYASNSRQVFGGLTNNQTMVFTFANPVYGFGADFGAFNDKGQGQRSLFEVLGQTVLPPVVTPSVRSFFGFISDTAFTQVVLRALPLTEAFGMDNVTFGAPRASVPTAPTPPAPVPAPAGLPLLAGALGFGALLRRITRRRA
ncbi:MAG: hypothetical protein ACOY5U_09210 [Pseudomonadota bacterium]